MDEAFHGGLKACGVYKIRFTEIFKFTFPLRPYKVILKNKKINFVVVIDTP